MTERVHVIGDVHGCADELDELLARLAPAAGDRIVFAGDLVAKGPDSARVVRTARALGADAVLGNHELPVLAYARALRDGGPRPDVKRTHRAAAESLSPDDLAWLEALPFSVRLPSVNALVVHAGLVPGVPLDAQAPEWFVNLRSIRPDGSPSKRIEDGVPWASTHRGPVHVVFGHDAVRGLQRHPHATGLDTGCVYGGELTALTLPDHTLTRVRAHRTHVEP